QIVAELRTRTLSKETLRPHVAVMAASLGLDKLELARTSSEGDAIYVAAAAVTASGVAAA
ncbi:MAG: hypothetical protein ACXU8U_05575, partial [Asticcacaulis sp.]